MTKTTKLPLPSQDTPGDNKVKVKKLYTLYARFSRQDGNFTSILKGERSKKKFKYLFHPEP